MSSPAIEPRADAYRGELPARIPSDILRRLSYRRYEVAMMHIAMEWILIVGIAWLCSSYWNPLLYVLAVLFIGGRLHALAILMHDGSHYLLCKQKSWNDWISDIFLAWPILITTESYRTNHREPRPTKSSFMTLDGETLAVTSLRAHQVRPIGSREVAHARSI